MGDDPLTNAAVEFIAAELREINQRDKPLPLDEWPWAEDYYFEDRRPGSPFHGWGRLDRYEAIKASSELFRLGSGRPHRTLLEVIAVRGEACVAYIELVDAGTEYVFKHINCVAFDNEIRLVRRVVRFDVDDREAAVALLDEWHAEIDD